MRRRGADLATFEQWLATAKPGSKIVYARANTLGDKHLSAETLAVWHPITCRCWGHRHYLPVLPVLKMQRLLRAERKKAAACAAALALMRI